MPEILEITLLGSFDLQIDGECINLDSRPLQKNLSYLAHHQGKSIPRVKLAGVATTSRRCKEALAEDLGLTRRPKPRRSIKA